MAKTFNSVEHRGNMTFIYRGKKQLSIGTLQRKGGIYFQGFEIQSGFTDLESAIGETVRRYKRDLPMKRRKIYSA